MRTEAGRLRGRLAEYYVGEGKDDAIVIELPKGGYTPAFRLREPASRTGDHAPRSYLRTDCPKKKIRRRVWLVAVGTSHRVGASSQSAGLKRRNDSGETPLRKRRFQTLTDFDGTEQAAAVSRDGKFVAFLSSRDGQTDVWVTQPGSGQFHNLTRGSDPELVNPSVRVLGFSPDGSLVTFWVRKPPAQQRANRHHGRCRRWAAQSRPYLEGAAEFDWSHDGSRLAYHTPASGDPLFVSDGTHASAGTNLYCARGTAFSFSVVGARQSVYLRRLRRAS